MHQHAYFPYGLSLWRCAVRYALLAFFRDSPVVAQKNKMAWVASSRGHTYYRRGRSTANGLSSVNVIYFSTELEAERAGYHRSTSRGC
jgi:hypothetical protein